MTSQKTPLIHKHKGTAIKDIPGDYKRWLLGQSDIDFYLAKALRGEAA